VCTQLHVRLKLARERQGLTLQTIAQRSGVREQNLWLIERGAFDELPTGLFGRHAVRNYAQAVGMSPDEALAEVAHLLREPEDPMDGLARVRGFARRKERKASEPIPVAEVTPTPAGDWRVRAAGAIDAAILAGIDLILLALTSLAGGVSTAEVMRTGSPAIVLLIILITVVYFVALGGIRNATIGARLVQAQGEPDTHEVVDASVAIGRGLRWAFRESSILVDWLMSAAYVQQILRTWRPRLTASSAVDRSEWLQRRTRSAA
jgi:transcriptional regulator with XRE-family HTH domain